MRGKENLSDQKLVERMCDAIRAGNTTYVASLLRSGFNANSLMHEDFPVAMLCITTNQLKMLGLFLEAGFNLRMHLDFFSKILSSANRSPEYLKICASIRSLFPELANLLATNGLLSSPPAAAAAASAAAEAAATGGGALEESCLPHHPYYGASAAYAAAATGGGGGGAPEERPSLIYRITSCSRALFAAFRRVTRGAAPQRPQMTVEHLRRVLKESHESDLELLRGKLSLKATNQTQKMIKEMWRSVCLLAGITGTQQFRAKPGAQDEFAKIIVIATHVGTDWLPQGAVNLSAICAAMPLEFDLSKPLSNAFIFILLDLGLSMSELKRTLDYRGGGNPFQEEQIPQQALSQARLLADTLTAIAVENDEIVAMRDKYNELPDDSASFSSPGLFGRTDLQCALSRAIHMGTDFDARSHAVQEVMIGGSSLDDEYDIGGSLAFVGLCDGACPRANAWLQYEKIDRLFDLCRAESMKRMNGVNATAATLLDDLDHVSVSSSHDDGSGGGVGGFERSCGGGAAPTSSWSSLSSTPLVSFDQVVPISTGQYESSQDDSSLVETLLNVAEHYKSVGRYDVADRMQSNIDLLRGRSINSIKRTNGPESAKSELVGADVMAQPEEIDKNKSAIFDSAVADMPKQSDVAYEFLAGQHDSAFAIYV